MAAPIRFIHCSDLHLGSRFVGLSDSSPELAKRMARSTYQALDNIVSKANNEEVDFVVFSGDVFDSVHATPYARKYFRDSLEKIGVPCYIAYGNHDYERMWELSIPLPENAYVFGNVPTRFTYPPNSNDPLVELIGVSYAEQAVHTKASRMDAELRPPQMRFAPMSEPSRLVSEMESLPSPSPTRSVM